MNQTGNYQETITKIETIIHKIEAGSLPLEQLFTEFAEAVQLLKECELFLNNGQKEMNLLIETLKFSESEKI